MNAPTDLGQWPVSRNTALLVTASWFPDVWREIESGQALARAAAWESAKPRPGDFNGAKTLEELREDWRRCHAIAEAYRAKARLLADRHVSTGLEQMASDRELAA